MVTKEVIHHQDLFEWCWAAEDELIPKPFFTSCYLLDGLLIDTGAPKGQMEFLNFIKNQQVKNPISKGLITHTHEDHIGGTHILAEEFQIPLYSSPQALLLLKNASNYTYPEYRELYWGAELHSVEALPVPKLISSHTGKYELTVVSTPGHAPDQIAFIECSKEWAFVADAILPKYQVLFGHTCNIQEDIAQIYRSIRKIYDFTEGMDNLKVFVSGKGVFQGQGYIKARLDEIEGLHKQVQGYKQKGFTAEKILEEIFVEEGIMGIMTNGELSHLNLVNSLYQWNA
ncbi:MAG: MBL fold metallo-hydrolase [Candidatus Hodarchaeales archaeon]|jgi:glyoxylase-like metal-dependent hydrolase (beta-lactamase superfamily II)